jgi:hypothetical protein
MDKPAWSPSENISPRKLFVKNNQDLCQARSISYITQAGAPGFEPGYTDSKSAVLPLHHAPIDTPQIERRVFYHMLNMDGNTTLMDYSTRQQAAQ